jgi:hypothetical protein
MYKFLEDWDRHQQLVKLGCVPSLTKQEFEKLKSLSQEKRNDHPYMRRCRSHVNEWMSNNSLVDLPVKFSHDDPQNSKYGIGIIGDTINAWLESKHPNLVFGRARVREGMEGYAQMMNGWSLSVAVDKNNGHKGSPREISIVTDPHYKECTYELIQECGTGSGNISPRHFPFQFEEYDENTGQFVLISNYGISEFESDNKIFQNENWKLNNENYIPNDNYQFYNTMNYNQQGQGQGQGQGFSNPNQGFSNQHQQQGGGFNNPNQGGGGGFSNQQQGGGFNNPNQGFDNQMQQQGRGRGRGKGRKGGQQSQFFGMNPNLPRGYSQQQQPMGNGNNNNQRQMMRGNGNGMWSNNNNKNMRLQNRMVSRRKNNKVSGSNGFTYGNNGSGPKMNIPRDKLSQYAQMWEKNAGIKTKKKMPDIINFYNKIAGNENPHKKSQGVKDLTKLMYEYQKDGFNQNDPKGRFLSKVLNTIGSLQQQQQQQKNYGNGNPRKRRNGGGLYNNQDNFGNYGNQQNPNRNYRKRQKTPNNHRGFQNTGYNDDNDYDQYEDEYNDDYYDDGMNQEGGNDETNILGGLFREIDNKFNIKQNNNQYMDTMNMSTDELIGQYGKTKGKYIDYNRKLAKVNEFFANPDEWGPNADNAVLPIVPYFCSQDEGYLMVDKNKIKQRDYSRWGEDEDESPFEYKVKNALTK